MSTVNANYDQLLLDALTLTRSLIEDTDGFTEMIRDMPTEERARLLVPALNVAILAREVAPEMNTLNWIQAMIRWRNEDSSSAD